MTSARTDSGVYLTGTAQADEEYRRLAYNVSQGYENLGTKMRAVQTSLERQSRLLGSKALFRLAVAVSTGLERLFRRETSLLNKFGSHSPQYRALASANTAAVTMAQAMEGLEERISIVKNPRELTDLEREGIRQQLKKVYVAVKGFQDSISHFHADTEAVYIPYAELNRTVNDILTSVMIYHRCMDQFSCLPDKEQFLRGDIPSLDSVVAGPAGEIWTRDKGEQILDRVEEQDRKAIVSVDVLAGLHKAEKSGTSRQGQSIQRMESMLGEVLSQVWKPECVRERTALQKALSHNPRLVAWLDQREKLLTDIRQRCEEMEKGRFPEESTLCRLEERVAGLTGMDLHPDPNHGQASILVPGGKSLTPGKVVGENPLFYREEPVRGQGVKQSLNAFIGASVLQMEDLVEADRRSRVEDLLSEIVGMRADEVAAMMHAEGITDPDVTEEAIAPFIQRQDYESLAVLLQGKRDARLASLHPGMAVVQGNLLELGAAALNAGQEALNLPEADYTKYTWESPQSAVLDFVKAGQDAVDRFVVRSGNDCVAFRQADNGKWYLIDSTHARQQEQTPLEFVQQRLQLQNRVFEMGVKDLTLFDAGMGINLGEELRLDQPRFEFVSFATEVVPQLDNPLPPGVDPV